MSSCSTKCCSSGIVALIFGLIASGCGVTEGERFLATMQPFGAIVSQVAGERIGVLLPAGGSPHTYEPRPSDARRAAQAAVLFYGDAGLDGWAASLETNRRIALLGLVPDSLQRPAYGVAGTDPHFWMDPAAVRALTPALADTLCRYDAAGCEAFRRNADAFVEQLGIVHDSLRTLLSRVAGTPILVAHPFLQYFAHRYDLRIVGVVEEMGGSEPSPRDMQRLVSAARSSSARAVVTLPQHSSRAAETVAGAAGIPIVELDPIGGADDYANLLYLNARTLLDALVARTPTL